MTEAEILPIPVTPAAEAAAVAENAVAVTEPVAAAVPEVRVPKPRASIRASLLMIKQEIDPKVAPGEHIMEIKVKEPKVVVVPPPVPEEVKVVKKRESIRASLLLIKQEIDPKVAPGEHIMEIKVKEPKPAVVAAPVEPAEPVVVKKRESIRKSLLLIKQEIDPKVAPGEHIMEIKVKEPKPAVVAAPVEPAEPVVVKKRESIRKSLLLIKQEIDPKVAPGEHIMEIKVKEPKAAVVPPPVPEPVVVKKRESIRASLLMIKQEIDPKVAPGEHIMEIKVKEPKAVVVPPPVPEPVVVKRRESIRKSLLLIKQDIDPNIPPGEHIMEIKVKEPKSAVTLAAGSDSVVPPVPSTAPIPAVTVTAVEVTSPPLPLPTPVPDPADPKAPSSVMGFINKFF
jgi:hypothetical protein